MTDINERVAVVETEVKNLTEKVDDLKETVHENHIQIQQQLQLMDDNSTKQHGQLAEKVIAIEKILHGWLMWVLGASAIISAIIGIYNLIK